jgi:hypothetical protein
MTNYAEALEQQLALLRWWKSEHGLRGADALVHAMCARVSDRDAIHGHIRVSVGSALQWGATYFWSAEIARLLSCAVPDNFVLSEELLPSNAAFWWFEQPVTIDGSQIGPLCAISWMRTPVYDSAEMVEQFGLKSGLVQTIPDGMPRPSRDAIVLVFYSRLQERGRPRPLLPATVIPWIIGQTLAETLARSPLGPDPPSGEPLRHAKLALVASGLAFLKQGVLVSERAQIERHARKRLAGAGFPHEPLVRVIELRRREGILHSDPKPGSGDRGPVDWSCQWIVRGHWRQQFYPTKHANQPIWITPYVKGPEDKPLKAPRAAVFAVIR